jgi:3-deoxy-D-manno-octulosonate 8-phosphate phosphatase (KDO 8-P phosphatase)
MQVSDAALEERFRELGGVFLTPAPVIADRLRALRGIVFDWDGVFNPGVKGDVTHSSFSEPDSMGTNLLRFALWRKRGEMPATAIVSGERNATALDFAKREHFDAIYLGVRNKHEALEKFCESRDIEPDELTFLFDDVNDLSVAADCGVRVLVRRNASPLLQDFVALNSLCDYVTAAQAGEHAVRETAELLMGLLGDYDVAVAARMASDGSYHEYFSERQSIETEVFGAD